MITKEVQEIIDEIERGVTIDEARIYKLCKQIKETYELKKL